MSEEKILSEADLLLVKLQNERVLSVQKDMKILEMEKLIADLRIQLSKRTLEDFVNENNTLVKTLTRRYDLPSERWEFNPDSGAIKISEVPK